MIYLSEGNLPLNECYDDEIVQEANSTYQLSFKFPTSDDKWKALKEEVKLVADDLDGEQYFTIFEIVKQHGYVTVYANQAMSALNHYSISQVNVDRVAGNVVMSALAGAFLRQSPFSFFSDIMDKHTLNVSNRSALDVLVKDKHSILGKWGGDLVRDKYQVSLLKNGGVENESLFMYKKNMRSYQQTTSTKELRTRIHFRKKIEVGEGESKKEQWLRVTVDSPLINKYQNIYEADMEVQDEDVKDLASLTAYGKQYYRTTLCDLIEDSLELDVVGTGDVPVKMFDVVTVYHERFDMDMRKKITKYRYSPMGKRLKSVGFGTVQRTLGGALGNLVSDAVKSETAGLADDFDAKLEKEIENANRVFDQKKEALTNEITDGIEEAKAEAEKKAQEVRDEIQLVDDKATELKKAVDKLSKRDEDNLAEFDKKIADLKKQSLTPEAIDKALEEAGFKDSMDDIRRQLSTVSQTAKVNAELIGGDGSTSYNKNRLLGATSQDVTGDYIEVGHNGDGFEVGKSYVISWSAVCRPYGRQDVAVEVLTAFVGSGAVKLVPVDTRFPTIDKTLIKKKDSLLEVYLGQYRASFSGDWYQPVNELVTISDSQTSWQIRPNFKTVADGQSATYDGEWSDTPTLIFDGGGS